MTSSYVSDQFKPTDDQAGRAGNQRRTLDRALGLLADPGKAAPSDERVKELLAERRMRK